MALTKNHLKDSIANHLNITKENASALIESFLEIIKKTLETGEDVMISGFGKFFVRNKNERRGRNPHTGEELTLEPRRVVTFKCAGRLKDRMNGEKE